MAEKNAVSEKNNPLQEKLERVQKALARMGYGSRREIERLIGEQKIRINGQLAKLGDHVKAGDKINIGNRSAVISSEVSRIRVLIYNKPEGEICTQKDEEGRKTVFDSIGKLNQGRWISVGRLDINSSGLLLFTNYGELANHLMHPSSEIEREYAVRVNGDVTDDMIKRLLKGVELEDGLLKFDSITDSGGQGANHWYHVILKEGKNREVRRLWQSQDVRVSRLTRVRYANLSLPRTLKLGRKVELSLDEIKTLFEFIKLEWPVSRDEAAKQRSKKAKNLSIKNQIYGSKKKSKSAWPAAARKNKARQK
ncbi:Ribosomal large subunit pseudouridine synthase B [hydrothermal vent metagenome]|uniref:Ribosomal large subunit pseudouridine synthase B n=1 Tax=hydrothermal vent metagenome TaxID=652676 RepID=A0A3B0X5S0_9ZZZZ